ncbi:MAG: hypothetical protein AAF907_00290, partial [Planctomycetota bacterium]
PLPAVPPVPVEPAAAAAVSPVARAVPRPPVARPGSPAPQAAAGTHDSHLQRAADVKRKLYIALCLAVGLAGAVATFGAALATAGAFLLPRSEGPFAVGLTACLIGAGVLRVVAGAFFSRVPLGYEPGWKERWFDGNRWKGADGQWYRTNPTLFLIDIWDCGVTLLWTAAASAAIALPLAVLVGGDAPLWGVPFGLAAAAWVTVRRQTAPLWWPPGWVWREVGGTFGGVGPLAGLVSRWSIFRTPPGGLSRPAVWAAGWLLTLLAIPFCLILAEVVGPFDEEPFQILALLFAIPGTFAPLAVPLLGWAAVRQVRASQARGDDPPIWGRRLAVFDAWVLPAGLIVLFCAGLPGGGLSLFYWEFDGDVGLEGREVELHIGLAYGGGALVGLSLAAALWLKLSRASRASTPPPFRPQPPAGSPHDTGAGLSRLFFPRDDDPDAGPLRGRETSAAIFAVLIVGAGALLWWIAQSRRQPEVLRADQAVVAVNEPPRDFPAPPVPPAIGFDDGSLRLGPGMPPYRLFEEAEAEPGDPWYGRLRIPNGWVRGLKLNAGQVETLEAAANRTRREWAARMATDCRVQSEEDGAFTFLFPDLSKRADRWEREFYDEVDPTLTVSQQKALREHVLFANDVPWNLMNTDAGQTWLTPFGRYATGVTISRQGEWFDKITATGRDSVAGESTSRPVRTLPKPLGVLGGALERRERGEPAFPAPPGAAPQTPADEATP